MPGIFSFLNRRADSEAAAESIAEAAKVGVWGDRFRFRDASVMMAAKAKWGLTEDQLAFLRTLLDTLGPLFLLLLKMVLKV